MIEHEIIIHKPRVSYHSTGGTNYKSNYGFAPPFIHSQDEFNEWWKDVGIPVGTFVTNKNTSFVTDTSIYFVIETITDFSKITKTHWSSGAPKNIRMLNLYSIKSGNTGYTFEPESADQYRRVTPQELMKVWDDRIPDSIQKHLNFEFLNKRPEASESV